VTVDPGLPGMLGTDDPRFEAGMEAAFAGLPPRSVPEARPTPLQKHYVLLSAQAPHGSW